MERSSPLSGGVPPRQGTHVLAARSDIVEAILLPPRETLSPLPSRPAERFGMRKEGTPRESELIRGHLQEPRARSRDRNVSVSSETSVTTNALRAHSWM